MYDIKDICDEIKNLEECELSQDMCKKLSSLYIIKDFYKKYYEDAGTRLVANETMMTSPMKER